MRFFKAPQAAAVLKHGILRRYLPVFVTKTGSNASEVVYLDAYAGPGLYDDGTPGSPALAVQTARAVAGSRSSTSLVGHLIERNKKSVTKLVDLLGDDFSWVVYQGEVEEWMPEILHGLAPATPLFAFIDPFGLPISFSTLLDILRRGGRRSGYGRVGGAATEVLLNFSIPGINRVGGQLTGRGTNPKWLRARDSMVAKMDAVLGGDWWQAIWRSDDPDRVELILEGYKDRILEGSDGWAIFDMEVSDRWKGPPSYHLLMLTQHPDGIWAFNEAISSASEEYRKFCHEHEGRLDLEPLAQRESEWVDEIAQNIEDILAEERSFSPVQNIDRVYGEAFGEAREKHLRKAIKRMYAEGKTSTNGVGNLKDVTIRRG